MFLCTQEKQGTRFFSERCLLAAKHRQHSDTSTQALKENSNQENMVVNESALKVFDEEGAALLVHVYRNIRDSHHLF